jgi:hypothetical protein
LLIWIQPMPACSQVSVPLNVQVKETAWTRLEPVVDPPLEPPVVVAPPVVPVVVPPPLLVLAEAPVVLELVTNWGWHMPAALQLSEQHCVGSLHEFPVSMQHWNIAAPQMVPVQQSD